MTLALPRGQLQLLVGLFRKEEDQIHFFQVQGQGAGSYVPGYHADETCQVQVSSPDLDS